MLAVTTPATDLTLLTTAELRAAVGIEDASKDAELAKLGARVAAAITGKCKVATGGAVPPTLRLETLTETIRNTVDRKEIVLSRRPIVSVTSVVEDGTTLTATEYEIEAASGLLRRLSDDEPTCWDTAKIIVVYRAGWETVPYNLKLAAEKLAKTLWGESVRDPAMRSVEVPGVISESYWVGPADDPLIPQEVTDLLGEYINDWV